jgi:large subunit ribosomal protein L31
MFFAALRPLSGANRGDMQMKQGIHPQYQECKVTCACGETFTTGSVRKEMRVDICSKCHPFFTGKQKLVDTGGRVDRFNKRYGMK